MLSEKDLVHLRRCVELAEEAFAAGDEPFGSVLVGGDGTVLFEDRNRVSGGDETRHPEFEIARWAGTNVAVADRGNCTVYTSGEHCPMCAAAHGWAGLGRIVYAVSGAQLTGWRDTWGLPRGGVNALPIRAIAPAVEVDGPAPELADTLRALHLAQLERTRGAL